MQISNWNHVTSFPLAERWCWRQFPIWLRLQRFNQRKGFGLENWQCLWVIYVVTFDFHVCVWMWTGSERGMLWHQHHFGENGNLSISPTVSEPMTGPMSKRNVNSAEEAVLVCCRPLQNRWECWTHEQREWELIENTPFPDGRHTKKRATRGGNPVQLNQIAAICTEHHPTNLLFTTLFIMPWQSHVIHEMKVTYERKHLRGRIVEVREANLGVGKNEEQRQMGICSFKFIWAQEDGLPYIHQGNGLKNICSFCFH